MFSCIMQEDIEKMSAREMIEYTTKGVRNAKVTVGIVQNGQMSFNVYGENSEKLLNKEYIYEIASITKVFTGQLFAKAINENKADLNDSISLFLNLPAKNYYPTIKRLLTHTSGYKNEYYEHYVSSNNFINGGNILNGITEEMVINRIGTINLENRNYPYDYSNFGVAVAGLVLTKIYDEEITSLFNNYLKNDLGLHNTKVSDGSGDLSHYCIYNKANPRIAAGALVSTVTDMMQYAQMQIDETLPYLGYSHSVWAQFNTPIYNYLEYNIKGTSKN